MTSLTSALLIGSKQELETLSVPTKIRKSTVNSIHLTDQLINKFKDIKYPIA